MARKVDPVEVLKVNNHLLWPWGYWLPLKRELKGDLEIGIIHWQLKTKVYVGVNLFEVARGRPSSIPDFVAQSQTIEYPTVEAMLAEWQVD